jgi:hypothetical protein
MGIGMTKDEKTCLALGQMISRMISDLRKQAGSEPGYARRAVTFPGGQVELFVVNDPKLANLFDRAADMAYNVENATPASEVN